MNVGLSRKTYFILGGGVLLILILYLIAAASPPKKKIDWKENFEGTKKSPYGSFLLKESLPELLNKDSLKVQEKSLFDLLALQEHKDVGYIIINDAFLGGQLEVDELLHFVSQGNQMFIAARDFPYQLLDTLDLSRFEFGEEDSLKVSISELVNSEHTIRFPAADMNYFVPGEKNEYEILTQHTSGRALLIRYTFGDGSLTLSSTPRIFSNYYMVQAERRTYISSALLPLAKSKEIWWDEYYKVNKLRFKGNQGQGGGRSSGGNEGALDYLLSQEGLAWAFWLSLLALLVYAIFEAKRKQRIIPIIDPLPNLTLDFTETVGRLYFRSSAHKEIAEKRIRALLAYIRERYFLKTDRFDEKFIKSLSAKSNIKESDIRLLFRNIERIRSANEISESQLIENDQYINAFYEKGAR
ncbi:MAG: DUF4350 domain-containing protein [Bacteroidota bacterium]